MQRFRGALDAALVGMMFAADASLLAPVGMASAESADDAATSEGDEPGSEPTPSQYETSCGAGNGADCSEVGRLYETGEGVAQDEDRAAKLFKQACKAGDSPGCTPRSGASAPRLSTARSERHDHLPPTEPLLVLRASSRWGAGLPGRARPSDVGCRGRRKRMGRSGSHLLQSAHDRA